ncbi:replication protein P [Ferrimonas pelagia]|uniref:Replication protein P n=1 Tax=Ferrimonas pelagia TaxID=1177826 RepID=A0ABP9EJH4_9GAMM
MHSVRDYAVSELVGQGGEQAARPQLSPNDGAFINKLFGELMAICPAWHRSYQTAESLAQAKRAWTKALMESGVTQPAQFAVGLKAARAAGRAFFPSPGEFIDWCTGADSAADFDAMIAKRPCRDNAERRARERVAWRCRTQLDENRARRVYAAALSEERAKQRRGEYLAEIRPELPARSAMPELTRKVMARCGGATEIERRMAAIRQRGRGVCPR